MNGRRTQTAPAGKDNAAPLETDDAAKAKAPKAGPAPAETVIEGEATDVAAGTPAAGSRPESQGGDAAGSHNTRPTDGPAKAAASRKPPPETPEPPPSGMPAMPPRGWMRLAFGLAALGIVLGIAALIWGHVQNNHAQQRIAALASEIRQSQSTLQKLQSAPPAKTELSQSAKSELAKLKSGQASATSDRDSLRSSLATVQNKTESNRKSIAALQNKVASNQKAIARFGQGKANLPALAAAAERNAKLAAATLALEIGDPVGKIPGAPEALSRYATTAPPTLASLRASFPKAAHKAESAGGTAGSGKGGLWTRIRHRVTSLVTVRHGDTVLAGSLASGTIAKAQQQLALGDLKAAVSTLDGLDKPAKAAMAPWLTKAQHLLAARAAIAKMAAATSSSAGGTSSGSQNSSGAGTSAPATGSGHA